MKSTITFDMLTLMEFCELGALDIAYELDPKRNQHRFITLEGYVCFTDVKRRHGGAEIDWKEFGNAILLSRYKPVLVCEGGFFTFIIGSPLKEFAGGKPLISGHLSAAIEFAFQEIPYRNLSRAFEFVAV